MLERFSGSVEPFASVDVADLVRWVGGIALSKWPQQSLHELKPAMVTDLNWFGFGTLSDPLVNALMAHFPGGEVHQRMLSAVMPGHFIEPHCDYQPPNWCCRLHVPLVTNARSKFIVNGKAYELRIGIAYRVNTEAEHSVTNDGDTPRVHFMFDVRV